MQDRTETELIARIAKMACITVVLITSIFAVSSYVRYRTNVEQTIIRDAERTRIIQEEKTARTKERMEAIPWYKKDN